MKSIIDLIIVFVLATVGFITFGGTPAGKGLSTEFNNEDNKNSQKNITITRPRSGDTVDGYVIVSGLARTFENQLAFRVVDGVTGKIVFEKNVITFSSEVGLFGPWDIEVDFSDFTEGRKYFLEALQYSAKDGSEIDKIRVPVIYWRSK